MLLLALDTATDGVAVALHDGTRVLDARRAGDARHHNEVLVPTIAEALAAAGRERGEVTDVAVGVGPGPFTGLRVGLVTARTLALAWGAALHGVCALDALAAQAVAQGAVPAEGEFLVATDARRREVHTARYRVEGGRPVRLGGPDVVAPSAVQRDGLTVVGRGAALYPEALGPAGPLADVDAGFLAQVAVDALDGRGGPGLLPAEPLYLRRPDAVEPGARKRVTA
ncbi:tRNA (adenosine(37)-N6)-threonylcarbamoyltransferase complex dimerization subunit type 1 TsaB [Paenibacillus sp. TRM 82003]|uniref:tRNA (adenosine(37)-N6)-threonylcarbamoyltransferase complex dimerization subunit type 1 TsaB n=1 Tax=Kineococcus sp. TRM81007 TaxID=2925831 RepID=UPI001F564938|nr:tRNA (adenosine(37)-N6)-threonylcarbamoyltransferase complex dimerization subunit type 1 TsaB [Kineococcus sp. TRM81007]MCI2238772.1 tRNA (adenosine(37)-N6)-threonylcarbamoyltransferase complex dimerization subunit type 1 TsaB [Kineococcus sp. TRM81007]MCI3924178.1 tRNA (adenosine(37)-N6)-threonylcarbamoyltransferase complex dimerization subunit type 1 TsaB [Paenibacillus sp. TRM 82003]